MNKKNFYKFIRFILFTFSVIFLCSNFDFKLATIKAFHIVEIANKDFYTNLKKTEVSNYTFLYDNDESKENIDFIVSVLNKHKSSVLQSLNIDKEPKITFRILSEFNESQSDALGYVYFHNNIINILNKESIGNLSYTSSENSKNLLFTETIIHEYTHALINTKFVQNNNFPNKLPFWFNEGIAEYMGRISINKPIPEFVFSDINLSDLNQLFESNSDKFYEYSSVFINSLVTDYGIDKLGVILDYLQFYKFEEALEKSTFSNLDDLSKEAFNSNF